MSEGGKEGGRERGCELMKDKRGGYPLIIHVCNSSGG